MTDDEFRREMREAVTEHGRDEFRRGRLGRARRGFALRRRRTSPTTRVDDKRSRRSTELDEERGTAGNRVYYLAVPPSGVRGDRRASSASAGMRRRGWTRLIVEKPFGHDLESARS